MPQMQGTREPVRRGLCHLRNRPGHKRWDTGPSAATRAGSWFSSLGMGASKGGPWPLIILVLLLMFGGSIISYILYTL